MGRMDEAIASARRAQELDPLSASITASVGWNYFYARRWDDAISQFKKAIGMDVGFLAAYEGLAKCYEHKGMEADALEALANEMEQADAQDVAEMLRQEYKRAGYRNAMRKLYRLKLDQFRQAAKTEYVSPFLLANLYALLGDRDQTFAWLEKSYAERSSKLTDLKVDPDFDGIRSDPRFADITRRIGLP
jgi:tetratricopeptide (TPR) repeat protein